MSRAIIPGAEAPITPPSDAAESKSTVAAAAPTAPNESLDTLAGALPAWDLLPGAPFIRRVK